MAGIPAEGDTPAPDPAAAAAAAAPAEVAKPEDAAAEVKPEDQAAKDLAAKAAEDEYTFDLDEPTPAVDPEQLSKIAEEKPEFKQLLESDPELKELLYHNAREAAEVKGFREFFPDVQSAKFAHENASTFIDVRDTFLGSTTADGTRATLQKMAQLAIERDEQGNPIIDPLTGQPKIGDDFYGFMDNARDLNMQYDREELQTRLTANQYPNDAARERDQIAAAAFDVLKEYYTPEQGAGTQDLPQELQARSAELDRREREMNDRAQKEKVGERQQFEQSLIKDSTTRVETSINRIIDSVIKQGATVAPFLREMLPNKIGSELMKVVAKDPKLKADMAELQRLPMTAEVRNRRLALVDKAIQIHLPNIARVQLKAAGVQLMRTQEDKLKKIDAQKNASRSEPKGSAASASPNTAPPSEEAAWQQATQHWQKTNPGRPVDRDAKNAIALLSIRLQTGQPLA
jgi:hypothetical protein